MCFVSCPLIHYPLSRLKRYLGLPRRNWLLVWIWFGVFIINASWLLSSSHSIYTKTNVSKPFGFSLVKDIKNLIGESKTTSDNRSLKLATTIKEEKLDIQGIIFRNNVSITSRNNLEIKGEKSPVEQSNAPRSSKSFKKSINHFRKYTYDNPTTFKGKILRSWPPSKNRSVQLYITEPFTIVPRQDKLTNKTLIIIVQSTPSDVNVRENWRQSWGKYANAQTSVFFLLGRGLNTHQEEDHQNVLKEQNRYGDIIQIEGLTEHYDNLTLKSLYSLKFFLSTDIFSAESTPPQYMLKVDTDTIVNLPLLYSRLTTDTRLKHLKNLLMGWCHCCGVKPDVWCRRISEHYKPYWYHGANRKTRAQKHKKYKNESINSLEFVEKWVIPDYMFNGREYPSYLAGGSGYVLSRGSAECIFNKAKEIPYFHLEDVYITGFVAQACGINRLNNPGFRNGRKKFDKENDLVIHCSNVNSKCNK